MRRQPSRWTAVATAVAGVALTVLAVGSSALSASGTAQLQGGTITCCSK